MIGAMLLVIYPAWDAAANYVDASCSGGPGSNRTQAINVAVSVITTSVVILALQDNMNWVIAVFGAWAIVSGLMQLGATIRRCKSMGAKIGADQEECPNWALLRTYDEGFTLRIQSVSQSA